MNKMKRMVWVLGLVNLALVAPTSGALAQSALSARANLVAEPGSGQVTPNACDANACMVSIDFINEGMFVASDVQAHCRFSTRHFTGSTLVTVPNGVEPGQVGTIQCLLQRSSHSEFPRGSLGAIEIFYVRDARGTRNQARVGLEMLP